MKTNQVFVSLSVGAIAQEESLFSDTTPITATIEDQAGGPNDAIPSPSSASSEQSAPVPVPTPQSSAAKGLRGYHKPYWGKPSWNYGYKKPYWNDYYWNKPYWGKPYWKPSWGYRGSRGTNRGGNNKSFWGSSSSNQGWGSVNSNQNYWGSSNQGWGSSTSNQGWGSSTSNQGSPTNTNQNYWGSSTSTSNQNYWGSPSTSTATVNNNNHEVVQEEGTGFDNGAPEGFGQPPPGVNVDGPPEGAAADNESSSSLSCPDTLDKSMQIPGGTGSTLFYAVVPDSSSGSGDGIFCGRLEVENDGWISLGFSPSSPGTMQGSAGVVGVLGEGTVLKYDLDNYQPVAMPADKQTLRDASISEVDGKTTMTFTKLLVEDGEVPIVEGENNFLHAWGGDVFSYHYGKTRFTINLFDDGPLEAEFDSEQSITQDGPEGVGPPNNDSEAEFAIGPPLDEEQQAALRVLPLKTTSSADTYSGSGIVCAVVAILISLLR